ncbi:MAG: hypothetical protein ACRDQY_26810 [Pseudonocardiaceae bacterium]
MSWYLRSMADADTHRGHYSVVTRSVHALCGIEFIPKELPLGGPALPGSPLDPQQVCPQCRFVSLLSDNGVPLEEISRLVGHSSTAVTELVYREGGLVVANHGQGGR